MFIPGAHSVQQERVIRARPVRGSTFLTTQIPQEAQAGKSSL